MTEQYFADYILVTTSGSSCNRVSTEEECRLAASILGASDTELSTESTYNYPPDCYLYGGTLESSLYFNYQDSSTTPCSSDNACICRAQGDPDHKFLKIFYMYGSA